MSSIGQRPWRTSSGKTKRKIHHSSGRCLAPPPDWLGTTQVSRRRRPITLLRRPVALPGFSPWGCRFATKGLCRHDFVTTLFCDSGLRRRHEGRESPIYKKKKQKKPKQPNNMLMWTWTFCPLPVMFFHCRKSHKWWKFTFKYAFRCVSLYEKDQCHSFVCMHSIKIASGGG